MSSKMSINKGYRAQGKHRSIEVVADELEIETDESKLLADVADAAREALASEIRSISAPVSPGTKRRPDHVGSRLFNDTGHLARALEVVVDQATGARDIRPPRDRLQDEALVERLAELVRSIREPFAAPRTAEALREAVSRAVRIK